MIGKRNFPGGTYAWGKERVWIHPKHFVIINLQTGEKTPCIDNYMEFWKRTMSYEDGKIDMALHEIETVLNGDDVIMNLMNRFYFER